MMPYSAPPSLDIVVWLAAEVSSGRFPAVPLIVVGLIAMAATTAIFGGSEERRKNAMAVLDRLLRWKGR
jgi:hypothetical protein